MSREKQIEEMARVLCEDCARDVAPCSLNKEGRMCNAVMEQAKALYNAGYRKSTEVAEEIFGEIGEHLEQTGKKGYVGTISGLLAELKKKYTEGGE